MIEMVERMATTPAEKRLRLRPTTTTTTRSPLPSCHPHWRVGTPSNDKKSGGPAIARSENDDETANSPIKRIYFYHVRKAGGTMIRKYLKKVASKHRIHLRILEYKHAYAEEEVGSRSDTFYVTNIRDPVERSVSHFKYDARWGCDQLVKNSSLFVPTSDNAMPFESWNYTGGFEEQSDCDEPFSFVSCAVNCYVQSFSGKGCTRDNWFTEYNLAWDRLLRYNMILVYSKFDDPEYVRAVEDFFGGVRGFNVPSSMFCGEEAREANRKVPLRVSFEHVLSLARLNEMDNRLYRDLVTSCFDEMEKQQQQQRGGGGGGGGASSAGGGGYYSFPRVDTSRFVAQKNRTLVD